MRYTFSAKMKSGALSIYTIRSTFISHRISDTVNVQKQLFRIHFSPKESSIVSIPAAEIYF